jgi:hypothetical protein
MVVVAILIDTLLSLVYVVGSVTRKIMRSQQIPSMAASCTYSYSYYHYHDDGRVEFEISVSRHQQ